MLVNTTLENFKEYFNRDFPFGSDIELHVLDSDVTKALDRAATQINTSLFATQAEYTIAFNHLSAHYLVTSINNSSQGLGSTFKWPANSRSVGGVSESVTIPDSVMKSPFLASLMSTGYGVAYLEQIWTLSRGAIYTSAGATTA